MNLQMITSVLSMRSDLILESSMSEEDNYGINEEDTGHIATTEIIAQAVTTLNNAQMLLQDALYLESLAQRVPLDTQRHLQLSSLEHIAVAIKALTDTLKVVRVQLNLPTQTENNWNV